MHATDKFIKPKNSNSKEKVDVITDSYIIPGIYQHYKNKQLYEVMFIARFSENPLEEFVIYKQLYDSTLNVDGNPLPDGAFPHGIRLPKGSCWARPKNMFAQLVKNEEGDIVPRFQFVQHITSKL